MLHIIIIEFDGYIFIWILKRRNKLDVKPLKIKFCDKQKKHKQIFYFLRKQLKTVSFVMPIYYVTWQIVKKKRKINFVNKACIVENISLWKIQWDQQNCGIRLINYNFKKSNKLGTQLCGIYCTTLSVYCVLCTVHCAVPRNKLIL